MSALSAQRLQLILSYLDAHEAFGCARVCRSFASTVETLNAEEFLQRIRPRTWNGAFPKELDQEFCRRLLRDWHFCLKNSTCQVGYVAYDQHLLFVEPSCKLAPSPQGSDPFPVSVDAKTYKCSIEEFYWDSLWWKCLDNELFHWPKETMRDDFKQAFANGPVSREGPLSPEDAERSRYDGPMSREDDPFQGLSAEDLVPAFNQGPGVPIGVPVQPVFVEVPIELEPVFGYSGDMSLPKLSEDVLAVLALNAAWFQDSFLTRQLQGILLLRDGRFLLIGSCEMQGTIDSQLCARVYRCFVSDSLMSLVTFAQDPRSREILRTRVPGSEMEQEKVSPNLNAALQEVKVPRIDYEDKAILEETFGEFKKASKESEGVLFNTLLMDQEELRANIKVGDLVRVKREGATFGWISCQCEGKSPIPQGPVAPDVEEDFVHSSKSQDLRWLSFSGGCHLGLLNGRYYQAKVVRVMDNGSRLDVQYLDPTEWANGNSGFTNGLGNDRHDSYIEADVDILRCTVLPSSSWYWSFKEVWDRCGSFASLSCDFGGERSSGGSVRAFPSGPWGYPSDAGAPEAPAFLKLADVFADTLPAHDFRCRILSEEKDMLPNDQGMIEELCASKEKGSDCFPRQKTMVLGKELGLKLLRVPTFWKKWMEQGGESPAKMTTLFKKEKLVRLVIQ